MDGKEVGGWIEEVYDHHGDGVGESEGRDIGKLGECNRGDGRNYMGEIVFSLASVMSFGFVRDEDLVHNLSD